MCNLGAALMDSGRAEEAMPHLRAALALIPHYPEARANLGNALLAKGHVHEGMAHYRRALKVDPGHANAALGLANALARRDGARTRSYVTGRRSPAPPTT